MADDRRQPLQHRGSANSEDLKCDCSPPDTSQVLARRGLPRLLSCTVQSRLDTLLLSWLKFAPEIALRYFALARFSAPTLEVACNPSFEIPVYCGTSASVANSFGVSCTEAAATFSSRCSTELVPGMGSMTRERRSSQANATCFGVA